MDDTHMAPLGVLTPGCRLAACLAVQLIVIKNFSSSARKSSSRAGGLV
jgi:hypothetical protein